MDAVSSEAHDLSSSLPSGEVHLWFLTDSIPAIGPICANGFIVLSPAERQRFCEMKNRSMARRFLLGRILMRRVLARYLDEDPAAIAFRYNANGKPELDISPETGLSFSLSHSSTEMILAVSRASAIGVDIETIDRADAAHRIGQQFFSAAEIRGLEAIGAKAPERALILWALKESIIKADGDTVWDGLATIPLMIEGCRIDFQPYWRLGAGLYAENYVLACAVKSSGEQPNDPLIFRTDWLAKGQANDNSFEPYFRT